MLNILELELENGIFFQLQLKCAPVVLSHEISCSAADVGFKILMEFAKKFSNILRLVRMSKTFPVIIAPEK